MENYLIDRYFDKVAKFLNCRKEEYGNGYVYRFPKQYGDSWFITVSPNEKLTYSDAFFTLLNPLVTYLEIPKEYFVICSLYKGNVTLIETGKKSKRLYQGIHIINGSNNKFKFTIKHDEPIWYTLAVVHKDIIYDDPHLSKFDLEYFKYTALDLSTYLYNTQDMMIVFEQIKYAVRSCTIPHFYYLGKIYEILSIISKNIESLETKLNPRYKHLSYQNLKFMWLVKDEIDKNILNPPSLEDMKNIAEMSESKLRRCFKTAYGKSIYEYIKNKKMEQALRFLSHDDMSIHNISTILGYESPSKFSAAFKKVYGFSPSTFRKSVDI